MEVKDLRLGMPYYRVSSTGIISIGKVHSLEFADKDKFKSPVINGEVLEKFGIDQFINAQNYNLAHRKMLDMLKKRLRDETRTFEEDKKWRERLAYLTEHKTKQEVRLTAEFAAVKPVDHFPLGTMLWYAKVDTWNIIRGPLLEVDSYREKFQYPDGYPESLKYGNPQYKNGFYPGVTYTDGFFDSEEAALDYLAEQFAKRLPGKLIRSQVPISAAEVYSKAKAACAGD